MTNSRPVETKPLQIWQHRPSRSATDFFAGDFHHDLNTQLSYWPSYIGAAKKLRTFATAFCLPNSFHVNGDQTKSGLSKFTYRPFTLEENFAFAAGVQEMLIQSYAGLIEVFPAVPADWKEVLFTNLRSEVAFLVSATRPGGLVDEVTVEAEKGGVARIKWPFKTYFVKAQKGVILKKTEGDLVELTMQKGGKIILKNGYE